MADLLGQCSSSSSRNGTYAHSDDVTKSDDEKLACRKVLKYIQRSDSDSSSSPGALDSSRKCDKNRHVSRLLIKTYRPTLSKMDQIDDHDGSENEDCEFDSEDQVRRNEYRKRVEEHYHRLVDKEDIPPELARRMSSDLVKAEDESEKENTHQASKLSEYHTGIDKSVWKAIDHQRSQSMEKPKLLSSPRCESSSVTPDKDTGVQSLEKEKCEKDVSGPDNNEDETCQNKLEESCSVSSEQRSRLDTEAYQSYTSEVLNSTSKSEKFLRLQRNFSLTEQIGEIEKTKVNKNNYRPKSWGPVSRKIVDDQSSEQISGLVSELQNTSKQKEFSYNTKYSSGNHPETNISTSKQKIGNLKAKFETGDKDNNKKVNCPKAGIKRQKAFADLSKKFKVLEKTTGTGNAQFPNEKKNVSHVRRHSAQGLNCSDSNINEEPISLNATQVQETQNDYEIHIDNLETVTQSPLEILHVRSISAPHSVSPSPTAISFQEIDIGEPFESNEALSSALRDSMKQGMLNDNGTEVNKERHQIGTSASPPSHQTFPRSKKNEKRPLTTDLKMSADKTSSASAVNESNITVNVTANQICINKKYINDRKTEDDIENKHILTENTTCPKEDILSQVEKNYSSDDNSFFNDKSNDPMEFYKEYKDKPLAEKCIDIHPSKFKLSSNWTVTSDVVVNGVQVSKPNDVHTTSKSTVESVALSNFERTVRNITSPDWSPAFHTVLSPDREIEQYGTQVTDYCAKSMKASTAGREPTVTKFAVIRKLKNKKLEEMKDGELDNSGSQERADNSSSKILGGQETKAVRKINFQPSWSKSNSPESLKSESKGTMYFADTKLIEKNTQNPVHNNIETDRMECDTETTAAKKAMGSTNSPNTEKENLRSFALAKMNIYRPALQKNKLSQDQTNPVEKSEVFSKISALTNLNRKNAHPATSDSKTVVHSSISELSKSTPSVKIVDDETDVKPSLSYKLKKWHTTDLVSVDNSDNVSDSGSTDTFIVKGSDDEREMHYIKDSNMPDITQHISNQRSHTDRSLVTGEVSDTKIAKCKSEPDLIKEYGENGNILRPAKSQLNLISDTSQSSHLGRKSSPPEKLRSSVLAGDNFHSNYTPPSNRYTRRSFPEYEAYVPPPEIMNDVLRVAESHKRDSPTAKPRKLSVAGKMTMDYLECLGTEWKNGRWSEKFDSQNLKNATERSDVSGFALGQPYSVKDAETYNSGCSTTRSFAVVSQPNDGRSVKNRENFKSTKSKHEITWSKEPLVTGEASQRYYNYGNQKKYGLEYSGNGREKYANQVGLPAKPEKPAVSTYTHEFKHEAGRTWSDPQKTNTKQEQSKERSPKSDPEPPHVETEENSSPLMNGDVTSPLSSPLSLSSPNSSILSNGYTNGPAEKRNPPIPGLRRPTESLSSLTAVEQLGVKLSPTDKVNGLNGINNQVFKHPTTQEKQKNRILTEKDVMRKEEEEKYRKWRLEELYEESKKKRMIQDEIDQEARKHSDFSPHQKSPIPVDRFGDDLTTEKPKPVVISTLKPGSGYGVPTERRRGFKVQGKAKALYSFTAQNPKELPFRKGDVIYLQRQLDKNWFEGEKNGRVGIFPVSYVEVVTPIDIASAAAAQAEGEARTKYDFRAHSSVELSLRKGEIVVLLRRIDDNWYEGRSGGRQGIFPISYVEVLREPATPMVTPVPSVIATPMTGTPEMLSPVGFEAPTPPPQPSPSVFTKSPTSTSFAFKQSSSPSQSRGPSSQPISQSQQQGIDYLISQLSPPVDRKKTSATESTVIKPSQALSSHSAPPSSVSISAVNKIDNSSNKFLDGDLILQRFRAVYNYKPQNEDELELKDGDEIFVMEKCDDGWFVGTSGRTGMFGTFPGNYVQALCKC